VAEIYQSDPNQAPDSDYVPGTLAHLLAGNRGRLLDDRRTPITVTAVRPETGAFELEIGAFEDAGARWELPLQDVARFQFARDARPAPAAVVADLERARARFDRDTRVDVDPAARAATLARLDTERARAREWLDGRLPGVDVAACVARRAGDKALYALCEQYLAARDLAAIDARFAETFVSNAASGEIVKGHAIVLADLGLCPYDGAIVRDPATFDGAWSRARRAEHLVARLALTQALLAALGHAAPTLHRGAAVDGLLPARRPASFVSATFSAAVADAHFEGGPETTTAVRWRQVVAPERVLMTFLETPAFNARYAEAEAVLVGDPANRAF
jgi:hypothetical protein